MPTTTSPLIGAREASEILHIHTATLFRWVASGKLKVAHQLPGKHGAIIFWRTHIEAVAARRNGGTPA